MSDTASTHGAKEHARAQADSVAARTRAKPTIPARDAKDLPAKVRPDDVVWAETIEGGGYASRVLARGARVRLENLDGDACVNLLVYNAEHPAERLNVADTVKVQWQAYLGEGALLLSDMGRVLMSFVRDTCGNHDTFCGASTSRSNAAKYGEGSNYGPYPNARDRFSLALVKHGLGKRDICANVNLFKGVRVEKGGALTWVDNSSAAGDCIELRAEMRLLFVVANTPHVLDPRRTYEVSPVRVLGYRGEITPEADPIRNSTPEKLRAFQNVEDYYGR
jgi:hypothetical protein